jgi:hypothetical protein
MDEPDSMRAAVPPPSTLSLRAAGAVDIQAAAGEGKRPTFDIVGYTGAPMMVEGFFSPVIIELTGLKPASQTIPALRDHDPSRVVGQTDAIAIGSDVRLTGTITDDGEEGSTVVGNAKNGFKWQASVGANIDRRELVEAGKKATVNGREVVGPIWIIRASTLKEISFVALGADGQTAASVAASHPSASNTPETTMTDQWLQAKGFDPAAITDPQRATLRAAFDAEQAPPPPAPPTPPPAAPENPGKVTAARSLDQILAENRKEQERVEKITATADQAMRDRPMMYERVGEMAKAAIEAGTSPTEFELHVLRETRYAAAPAGFARGDSGKASVKVVEAALAIGGGLEHPEKHFDERTLNAAEERYKNGLGLVDVLMLAARENGAHGMTRTDVRGLLEAAFKPELRAQGWSTLSLPGVFANTANKFLMDGFSAVEDTWRQISARRSVRDFKTVTSYSLTGGFEYEKVGPGGELKHATVGEMSYTNRAETYGRMFAITRQDIINDDLGALTQVPRMLGRGAALALNKVFWTAFLNNSAFFTSGRGNYVSGAGTALSIAALTTATTAFQNQTDPDGYPVAITPRILLVPNALSVTAANLMNSTQIAGDTTANTVTFANNPFAGRFRVVGSSYLSNSALTGYSTTAYYLLADPNDLPVIEVAFLNGRERPTVDSADADFNTLGVQFRGFHDFGVSLQEYRAGLKAAGA